MTDREVLVHEIVAESFVTTFVLGYVVLFAALLRWFARSWFGGGSPRHPEPTQTREPTLAERIEPAADAGTCACEVKGPSGKCR
jgi:hypothetical protein